MKVGDVLQNGQVPPEEPPVGSVVTDREGDIWRHDADKVWLCPSADMWREWAAIVNRWGPLTVTELPVDLTPEPRYLPLEDVRVGMRIRVTQTWPDGNRVVQGKVTKAAGPEVCIGGVPHYLGARRSTVTEIVLLEPVPMPEPPAPALVRHAGRLWARGEHEDTGVPWHILSGPPMLAHGTRLRWVCWADLLALDPARTPEIVEV